MGASQHGGRNGSLFAIDPIGNLGDFLDFEAAASMLFNLTEGDVQLRLGPELRGAATIGDENTGGSSLYSISAGPRAELDWRRVWGSGIFAGPSRLGLDFTVGYGGGTTTAETFSLHSQSGVELSTSAALNLFNVSVGGVEVGLDFFARTSAIFGGSFNTPFNTLGGTLVFRTAEEPPVVLENSCPALEQADYVAQIEQFREANRLLREENAEHAQLVAAIRTRLEEREITREEMVDELRNGYVDYLANREENPVTDEAEARALAEARFPDEFDPFLWQEVEPVPEEEMPTDCDELRALERRLRDENAELREQKGLLLGLARMGLIRLGVPEAVADQYTSAIARLRDVNFRTNTPFGQRAEEGRGSNETGYNRDADIATIEAAATAWSGSHPIDPATGLREAAPQAELERVFGPLFPPGEGRDGASHYHSIDILRDLAAALRDPSMRDMQISLVGHTSSPGSDEHNMALSRRRARAIRSFLVMQGVPENRLFFDGRGETELIYQRDVIGGGETAHRMNAEFSTLSRYGISTTAQRREEALRRQSVNRRMEITLCLPNSTDEACTALRADPDILSQMQAAGVLSSGTGRSPTSTATDLDESASGGGEASTSVPDAEAEETGARRRRRRETETPPPPPPLAPPPAETGTGFRNPPADPEAGE